MKKCSFVLVAGLVVLGLSVVASAADRPLPDFLRATQFPAMSEAEKYEQKLQLSANRPARDFTVPAGGGPVNDLCIDRIDIFDGVTAFNTAGATTDGPGEPGCTGGPGPVNDIWYNYVATCDGKLTVSTCEELGGSATFDTVLAAYKGLGCAPLGPLVGCNDDDAANPCGSGAGGFHSTMSIDVVLDNTYKIRVGGFSGGDSGPGDLLIDCAADTCLNGLLDPGEECDPTAQPPGDTCPDGTLCLEDCTCPAGECCDPDKTPENEPCPEDTNGGCNSSPFVFGSIDCEEAVCGTVWAEGGNRDTDWYSIDIPSDNTIITATVAANCPVVVFILSGLPDCVGVEVIGEIGCGGPECNPVASATVKVDAGKYGIFVGTGNCDGSGIFDGIPCECEYTVTVNCEVQGVCPGEGNCFENNGTPGCNDLACCELVCDQDPFCCDGPWDQICADEAQIKCGNAACGVPGSGDCCDPAGTGSPGCEDTICCKKVCLADSFCCDIEWDSFCAEDADAKGCCGNVCKDAEGDCCTANGTVGCDRLECCKTVCECDPFCCEIEWDSFCAGEGKVPGCGAAVLCDQCIEVDIPTVSEWGLILLTLLLLTAGTIVFRRTQPSTA